MAREDPRIRVRERLEDLCREIGTLLLAFTPLDSVLWEDRPYHSALELTFFLVAVLLLSIAILSESRRIRG